MLPKKEELLLPILKVCKDSKKHAREIASILANEFKLTQEERTVHGKSSKSPLLLTRVLFAVFDLKCAGLVFRKNNIVSITDGGLEILKQNPPKIDVEFLRTIPKYIEYEKEKKERIKQKKLDDPDIEQTPDDIMSKEDIKKELIKKIQSNSPGFFENLVHDLLRKMGYGIESEVLGKPGDGGIDGVIREDKLGFDEIYFQAKRYQSTVPIHDIRDFIGALAIKKSKKGVFITSSSFPDDAVDIIKNVDAKIKLIDGDRLTEHMYDYNMGVEITKTQHIKEIDESYFEL